MVRLAKRKSVVRVWSLIFNPLFCKQKKGWFHFYRSRHKIGELSHDLFLISVGVYCVFKSNVLLNRNYPVQ